jgi:hypothetical protein
MLWLLTLLVLGLWLLGMLSGYALGVWVHLLFGLAILALIAAMVRRRVV